jgi:hypothetical protein
VFPRHGSNPVLRSGLKDVPAREPHPSEEREEFARRSTSDVRNGPADRFGLRTKADEHTQGQRIAQDDTTEQQNEFGAGCTVSVTHPESYTTCLSTEEQRSWSAFGGAPRPDAVPYR